MKNREVQKPITVRREEFKQELADLINNSGLYAFIVEPILAEFLAETRAAVHMQYQEELNKYNEECINSEEKQD